MDQLKPLVQSDSVVAVQAGFLGNAGEWAHDAYNRAESTEDAASLPTPHKTNGLRPLVESSVARPAGPQPHPKRHGPQCVPPKVGLRLCAGPLRADSHARRAARGLGRLRRARKRADPRGRGPARRLRCSGVGLRSGGREQRAYRCSGGAARLLRRGLHVERQRRRYALRRHAHENAAATPGAARSAYASKATPRPLFKPSVGAARRRSSAA